MIRHDVNVTAETLVAVVALELRPRHTPIGFGGVPRSQVADQPRDQAIGWDHRQARLEQRRDVGFDERLRFHRGDYRSSVQRFAIVTDAARPPREVSRKDWITRIHDRPAINENLSANLLADHLRVEATRAAVRRSDTASKPQVGGLLGGIANAAPPQHGFIFDDRVEPRLTDLRGGQLGIKTVIRHRPSKRERPRQIVIRDHERQASSLVEVVQHFPELGADALMTPAFDGTPQVHADELAQHTRVGAFKVIGWQI